MNANDLTSNLNLSSFISRDNAWKAVAAGSAVLASVAMRQIVTSGWKAIKKNDPPVNPASPDTTWKEALAWTVATSVAIGLARLLAQRGADSLWTRVTGSTPPGRNHEALSRV